MLDCQTYNFYTMGGILNKKDVILFHDVNLLEFPFWTPENKKDQDCFVIETTEGTYTLYTPKKVPNHKDALFLYFFLYMAQELQTSVLNFNPHQFIKDIGLPPNARNYEALKEALEKFNRCSMEFKNTFVEYEKSVKNGKEITVTTRTNKGFGILTYDQTSIEKRYEGQKKSRYQHNYQVTIDKNFLRATKNSNFKINFNVKTFAALQDPIKRRFFEWLPKQLIGRDKYFISDEMLFPKLFIERPQYMSLTERKLKTYKTKIKQINDHIEFYEYSMSWIKKTDHFQLVFAKTKKLEKQPKQQELFDSQKERDLGYLQELIYRLFYALVSVKPGMSW